VFRIASLSGLDEHVAGTPVRRLGRPLLAAATGATLAELMARLGHSTVSAAMRYQHAAADWDKAIAEALSKMATVTTIDAAAGGRPRLAQAAPPQKL
jgi:hypothetical protein